MVDDDMTQFEYKDYQIIEWSAILFTFIGASLENARMEEGKGGRKRAH